MKILHLLITLVSLAVLLLSGACSAATPTPNVESTVAAAIGATGTAQARQQSTVNSAVAGTAAAAPSQTPLPTYTPLPALPTYTPLPTTAPIPTLPPQPTPTPVVPANLSQQEMANSVDSSTQEAVYSAEQAAAYALMACSDGVITPQEALVLMNYALWATGEIDQAYALAEQYLSLYGELADESIALLKAIEQDLTAMSQSMTTMTATLQEINKAAQQGQAVTQEMLKKLQTQAQTVTAKMTAAKTEAQNWSKKVQGELDKRAQGLAALKPTSLAADRAGAIKQLQDYIAGVKNALADGKFSKAELDQVLQLGVNAGASLKAAGGVGTAQLPDAIGTLNQQLARGQLPQAKSGLANLDSIAPKRP